MHILVVHPKHSLCIIIDGVVPCSVGLVLRCRSGRFEVRRYVGTQSGGTLRQSADGVRDRGKEVPSRHSISSCRSQIPRRHFARDFLLRLHFWTHAHRLVALRHRIVRLLQSLNPHVLLNGLPPVLVSLVILVPLPSGFVSFVLPPL